jgi:DNA-binding NarL/FixJ family response regulator
LTISKGERYIRGVIADIVFSDVPVSNKQFNITKRENEILQLIFDGLKNREIAEKLNIAERTVEFHKQNIYLKLEVSNSVDLYKSAQRHNLLSEDQLYHL